MTREDIKNNRDAVRAYADEIRALLGEAYQFQSTSKAAKDNINAALDLLDDIEKLA